MELICYDFNRICRTCKNESQDMRSLFDSGARFDEMLMACTSIQIDIQDGLPSLMCKLCINQLLMAYHFKQQCELTDSVLRTYADVNNISIRGSKAEKTNHYVHEQEIIKQEEENKSKSDISLNNSLINENHWLHDEINDDSLDARVEAKLRDNQVILTCPTCAKIFTTVDGLKCHQRMHTGDMFQCKLCDKKYTRLNHLHRHELSHGQSKMHICKICNKGLTRFEHLKRHLITHLKEKPFPCHRCNRGFSRWEHLSKHLQRCKGEPVFICEICNKNFVREDSLIAHLKIHEGKDKPMLPTLATLDDIYDHYIETEYDENKILNPDQNGEVDAEELEFLEPQVDIEEKDHCFENKFTECNLDQEDSDQNSSNPNGKEGIDSPTKRGRGRPRKETLHSQLFKTDGNFHCQLCDKMFNDIRLFERHEKLHERLRTYQCTICDKEFSRSYHLKRHMASHMSQKLITCQFCKKSFNKQEYLFDHIKLHMEENLKDNNEGQMECLACRTKFESIESLNDHKCPS